MMPGDLAAHARAATTGSSSKLRLLLLVLEGYAYIAIVVAVLVGAPVLIVLGLLSRRPFVALAAILIGVPLLLVARTAVRALLFRIPPPEGVRITPAEAPLLCTEVERIRRAVEAPRVHEIVVVGGFNASALQLPRFAVFWPRNYLLVGLPLFTMLSCDQMRAVIAHELAHLSRSHGRLSLLVHRLRLSWLRLLDALGASTPTFALALFRWYAPRLHAHSTALARQHELVVDRLAATVAGRDAAAGALVALGIAGPLYEEALWAAMARDETDGAGPYSRAQPDVWRLVAEEGEARLEALLAQTPDSWDTHPTLGERLAAIGATPRMPEPPERRAGDVWLASQMATIATRLDEQWAAAHGEAWRRRRDERRDARERLATLEHVAAPSPAELHEQAQLVDSLDGASAALPLYERAAAAGSAGAALAIGTILLERGDEGGIALIERAVTGDASSGATGHRRIAAFLESRGRMVEANHHATLAKAAATHASIAAEERRELAPVDRFAAHGLDQAALAPIVACLTRTREVQAACLVLKELRHSVGRQLVLAVDASGTVSALRDQLIAEGILPEGSTVVVLGRRDAALRQALLAVPEAQIYTACTR